MRTERSSRSTGIGTNALASSIVLVCRRRSDDAPLATRREFLTALRAELPRALRLLQSGNIAPVDLAQAAIGPGMAVYTRYAKVLDAQGEQVSVRDALALINQILDEVLAEQEGDFDADTRWALAWYESQGFKAGEYGVADTLSKAKNTSVAGMVEAGIVESKAGQVRLLQPDELPGGLEPRQRQPPHDLGGCSPSDPRPRNGRRVPRRDPRPATRRRCRDGSRTRLSPLRRRRTQEPRGGSPVVQHPRAKLAGDRPTRPISPVRAG